MQDFLKQCWLHLGVHFGVILGAKCATILILGPLGPDFGTLLLHLISHRFFYGFGDPTGVGGGRDLLPGTGFPPLCFSTFYFKMQLTQCVFEVFRISLFSVSLRGRLPKGNLPLPEVSPETLGNYWRLLGSLEICISKTPQILANRSVLRGWRHG